MTRPSSSLAGSDPAVKAMLLPFEQGLIATPEAGQAFLIRAHADPAFGEHWRRRLICEQTFKPEATRLQAQGFELVTRMTGGPYRLGLCLLTKHKDENLANLGRAWTLLAPGGVLVGAGLKELGAGSIERQVNERLGTTGSLYKHHCRVFWSTKDLRNAAAPPDWLDLDRMVASVDGTYFSRPGLFSSDRVDPGSRLLLDNVPEDLAGDVADLGAGWGYLSVNLLQRYPAIRVLDLFEAELLALEAARANLAGESARARFHWHDVAAGLPPERRFDWIVTNPPFHTGKAEDVELGRAFITAAAAALGARGRLVLVANRQLPYEVTLRQQLAHVRQLAQDNRYKVLLASRD